MVTTKMDRSISNYKIFESVIKCKWTMAILDKLSTEIRQPGKLERSIPGLSAKVMYERLKKLERFDIIKKKRISSKPLKVYYLLTGYGRRFIKILNLIKNLT